jgi:hypothetical protein
MNAITIKGRGSGSSAKGPREGKVIMNKGRESGAAIKIRRESDDNEETREV